MTAPITTAEEMREAAAAWHDMQGRKHDILPDCVLELYRRSAAAIRALPIAEPQSDARKRVRHLKRGTFYRVVGPAVMQTADPVCDDTSLIVYQAEKDGSFWVRPTREFEDGRFEDAPIAEPQTVDTAKPSWPDAANFHFGQLVEKPRGAHWSGHVCGWYSTPATRIGYNVLSDRHENSVQIYPEAALVAKPQKEVMSTDTKPNPVDDSPGQSANDRGVPPDADPTHMDWDTLSVARRERDQALARLAQAERERDENKRWAEITRGNGRMTASTELSRALDGLQKTEHERNTARTERDEARANLAQSEHKRAALRAQVRETGSARDGLAAACCTLRAELAAAREEMRIAKEALIDIGYPDGARLNVDSMQMAARKAIAALDALKASDAAALDGEYKSNMSQSTW
jgi:hypothetical protein